MGVFSASAEAMRAIIDLHFPETTVADVTYGQGTFYRLLSEPDFASDMRPIAPVQADARRLPLLSNSLGLVVFDPPFKYAGRQYDDRYGQSYLSFNTETKVDRIYQESLPELVRVAAQGIIVKVNDGSDGHRLYPRHLEIAAQMQELTGLRLHDYAILVGFRRISRLTGGRAARLFQKPFSYFLIWKWQSKNPFRQVRY